MVLVLVCSFLLLVECTLAAFGAGVVVSAVGCDWVGVVVLAVPAVVVELAASAGAAIREVAIKAAEIVFSMVVSLHRGSEVPASPGSSIMAATLGVPH